jgi:hypothetical protein
MLEVWFMFLAGSFTVSILMLTFVQMRAWKKKGWWRASYERPLETYWSELSAIERVLLWPGLVAFFLTLLALSIWDLTH